MSAESILPQYPGVVRKFVAADTWANIKASYPASLYDGLYCMATDLGANSQGVVFRSVSGKWVKQHPFLLFANGASSYAVSNTTAETTALSLTIPGGIMGVNGYLRIWTVNDCQATTNSKQLRVRAGGNNMGIYSQASSSNTLMRGCFEIRTAGVETEVRGINGTFGNSSSSVLSATVDTSADWTLALQVTMGVNTETVTVNRVFVEAF